MCLLCNYFMRMLLERTAQNKQQVCEGELSSIWQFLLTSRKSEFPDPDLGGFALDCGVTHAGRSPRGQLSVVSGDDQSAQGASMKMTSWKRS